MSDKPDGCGNCRFFATEGNSGICRRFPPGVFLIPGGGMQGPQLLGLHPPRSATDYCGEHRAKQEPASVTVLYPAAPDGSVPPQPEGA